MGRFYQTAVSEFIDGTIYEHPWELAAQAISTQDARNDQTIAEAGLFEGELGTINFLNFDEENRRVKTIQDKYSTRIGGLTQSVHDNPLDYQRQMRELRNLRREYQADRTSGDLYQIDKRYSDYQSWLEDNKEVRKTSPNEFNRLNKHFLDDIIKRGTQDVSAAFQGQQVISRPDMEKYREVFQNIKSDITVETDGRYMYKDETIDEQEVASIAWNTLSSDPSFAGYVQQMGMTLGDPNYFNPDGSIASPFVYQDEQGATYNYEQYRNLGAEEKKRVRRVLDPNNPFANDIAAVAGTYATSQREVDVNPYGMEQTKGAIRSQLSAQDAGQDAQLEGLRQRGREDLLRLKYSLMGERDQEQYKIKLKLLGEEDPDATKTLDQLEAYETIGIIGNPNVSSRSDRQIIADKRESGLLPIGPEGTYITAAPGTAAHAAQSRMQNAMEEAQVPLKGKEITLSNGKTFQSDEYLEYLGDRMHTTDLATEFLEKNHLSARGVRSTSQKLADTVDWFPGFLKTDFGADLATISELGDQYEEKKDAYYDRVSRGTAQLPFHPIIDPEVSRAMLTEVRDYNPQAFNVITSDGSIVSDRQKRKILEKVTQEQPLYVTASNTHSEMAMRVTVEGENYFIAPSTGNDGQINLMTGLSMLGVDPNSKYYRNIRDRRVTEIQQQLQAASTNTKGTRVISRPIYGNMMSIELEGETVHIRRPHQALEEPPVRSFSNLTEMFNTIANMQNSQTEGQRDAFREGWMSEEQRDALREERMSTENPSIQEVEIQTSRSTGPAEN